MVFHLLHPRLREALEERGIREPTEPQRRAIPLVLEGRNVLVVAPTGSGKTEAAMLPIFSRLLADPPAEPGIYVLYITPLRALNRDLLDRLRWWGERLGFPVDVRHGDTDKADRQRQSRTPPAVLITTPETMQAVMTGRRLLEHLRQVRHVVVDEVHELAEDKRGVQLSLTLQRLRYHVGRDFQVVGLSATVGSPEEVARFLFGDGPFEVVYVSVAREMELAVARPVPTEADVEAARRANMFPEVVARMRLIRELVEANRSTIIFVNTRSMAELLGFRLAHLYPDLPAAVHHSSLSKLARLSVEERLKRGDLKAVVATSSLELGIDIGHVDLVIQYVSPHQVIRLLQRVGRSGHRLTARPKGVVIPEDLNDLMESMVIARRARAGLIEPTPIPRKPYDVLVNQVVAFLLLKPRWRLEELHAVITRAYPYRDLTLDELRRVVKFMQDLRPRLALYFEEDDAVVRPRNRGVYRYFYETLSMIPDDRQYAVVDDSTGELVGTLDEAFVAEYGSPGVKFIFRGRPWVIRAVDDRSIRVSPVDDPTGAIPSWVGEEIPVPYEVAQEVGWLKREIAEGRMEARQLAERYGVDLETASHVVEEVKAQDGPLPDHRTIVVEQHAPNLVIVHGHFGTLANRTLGKLLGELLIRELERPVGVHQDPYGIILQASEPLRAEAVAGLLRRLADMAPEEVAELVKAALVKSGSFKRRLLHVAKRMGAVDKEADVQTVSLSKLVEAFGGTPVFDETLREALERDLDLQHAMEIVERIKRGEVAVETWPRPTHLGRLLHEKLAHRLEIIPPERLRRLVLESAKARLLNAAMLAACPSCRWHGVVRVGELADARCPQCGGPIGVLRSLWTDNPEREIRRRRDEIQRTAELAARHGWRALYVLASRLPLEAVQQLLAEADGDLNALTEAILAREREHMKARLLEA